MTEAVGWFRKYRYTNAGLTSGPWHLIRTRNRYDSFAYCGVDDYSARRNTAHTSVPAGEVPEGKVCPKCIRMKESP